MSWGPYWMFYKCQKCGKLFRNELEEMNEKKFGKCPICQGDGALVAESKEYPDNADEYEAV